MTFCSDNGAVAASGDSARRPARSGWHGVVGRVSSTILKAAGGIRRDSGHHRQAGGGDRMQADLRLLQKLGDTDETYDIHGVEPDACAGLLYVSGVG